MTSSSVLQARAVGPAAAEALAPGVTLRVQGVFPSILNLEVAGAGDLVSLTGPAGEVYPHAVTLERTPDVRAWGLAPGAAVAFTLGALHLPAAAGPTRIDLSRARRPAHRPLPRIATLGAALEACVRRLTALQAAAGTDLSLDALRGEAPARTPLGAALTRAALGVIGADLAALPGAVAALAGLGPGLTPAGDDLLAGLLAGARAAGRDPWAAAFGLALAEALPRTTALSSSLLRHALRGSWPGPLLDLACALSADRAPPALAALEALAAMGHSSGMDLATGLVMALSPWPAAAGRARQSNGGAPSASHSGTV